LASYGQTQQPEGDVMKDKEAGSGGMPPRGGMPAPKPLTDAQKQTVKDLF
jgi:hypothetical protein